MNNRLSEQYSGRCHCGAVQFEITSDFKELTTCDSSICHLKNAVMVKVHESHFSLVTGKDKLTEYQFHTMTARHFFCSVCGIYTFHNKRVAPDSYGINIFCLKDFNPDGIPIRQTVGAAMK